MNVVISKLPPIGQTLNSCFDGFESTQPRLQALNSKQDWRYMKSAENPVDCVSQVFSAAELLDRGNARCGLA